jgi:hypothetical protein
MQAITQMEAQHPLPTMFMRTVIVALGEAPKLKNFIVDVLNRLVGKNVSVPLHVALHRSVLPARAPHAACTYAAPAARRRAAIPATACPAAHGARSMCTCRS